MRRVLPRPIRRTLRLSYCLALDGLDLCLGRRRYLVPPRWMNFVGDGDFEKTGDEFFGYFTRLGGLQPSQTVLEVGCGIGRMARPLTKYLNGGSYEGLDIVPAGIRWCQANITARHPRFRFTLADIRNTAYNRKGILLASQYRFPYPDAHFDFAFLTSVFTHLLSADTDHYLSELCRVLRPGGKCLATFFLLNEESRQAVDSEKSSLLFRYPVDGCWATNPQAPETVAYDETEMGSTFEKKGFALESTHHGKWCGRSDYLSYQDILVLRKR
jgi:ubiquinone/menaquinone biosynthesis C-methylase UbiE